MRFRFPSLRRIAGWSWKAAASAAAFLAVMWFLAPYFVEDPFPALAERTEVKFWRDRSGEAVWAERTYDHQWRFNVRLSDIPDDVVKFMLGAEDSRFFSHSGVDYLSLARAFWQDLIHFRIVSGASTISMQVADMSYLNSKRGLWRKFLQAAKARKMEMLHTKEEILEAYFNNIPYGGQYYGIEAACRAYFGLHASEIDVVEASILVGLPQAPNRYRPDRHPEAARRRQSRVLLQLVRRGMMDEAEAARICEASRIRYRDFSMPPDFETISEAKEWTHALWTIGTIDARLTRMVRRFLAKRTERVEDVNDAAAIVMDVPSGEVRAYVGTLDWARPGDGQVDAARAVRSAGSVLKPFIYLEALEGGIITPETKLLDAPVRYGSYAPSNYDGSFRGEVTATEALSASLNTPAVRLVARLGERRVTEAFSSWGLAAEGQVATNGLSLALGSAGYRLLDIAGAYRSLAAKDSPAVRDLGAMLRARPLPGCDLDVAWKTGTSNNHCDAWCVAYTKDWVVAVWFGNKSGRRSKRLVGAELAAPAAGEIMSYLYRSEEPPNWGRPPVREFERMETAAPPKPPLAILSPAPKNYQIDPEEDALELKFISNTEGVYWYSDGMGIGFRPPPGRFGRGRHKVKAVPPKGPAATVEFSIGTPDFLIGGD